MINSVNFLLCIFFDLYKLYEFLIYINKQKKNLLLFFYLYYPQLILDMKHIKKY